MRSFELTAIPVNVFMEVYVLHVITEIVIRWSSCGCLLAVGLTDYIKWPLMTTQRAFLFLLNLICKVV